MAKSNVSQIKRNYSAERRARIRMQQWMTAIAHEAFRKAFQEMWSAAETERMPKTVGTFVNGYLRAMRDCLEDRERRSPFTRLALRQASEYRREKARQAA